MDKAHDVENISFSGTILRFRVDGKDYEIDVARHSDRLVNATPEQRSDFVLSPSGYGIHWPQIDEDLSIDGLIGITHTRGQTKAIA
jgi:hypothetical protein